MSLTRPIPSEGPAKAVMELMRQPLPPFLRAVPKAGDFTWPYRAARHVMAGENPYREMKAIGPYPYDAPFYYPLSFALVVVPFAWIRQRLAATIMFGLATSCVAWGLSRNGFGRFWLFLSAPFFMCATLTQLGPLLVLVGALLPWLGGLLSVKPNLGLALFAARPSWKAVASGMIVLALSFAVLPSWAEDWYETLRQHHHGPPLLLELGPLLTLAALKWKEERGRMLFVLSCVPQVVMYYDQLPLMLVPAAGRRSAAFCAWTWLSFLIWRTFYDPGDGFEGWTFHWIGYTLFFPALWIVLGADVRKLVARVHRNWSARVSSGTGNR